MSAADRAGVAESGQPRTYHPSGDGGTDASAYALGFADGRKSAYAEAIWWASNTPYWGSGLSVKDAIVNTLRRLAAGVMFTRDSEWSSRYAGTTCRVASDEVQFAELISECLDKGAANPAPELGGSDTAHGVAVATYNAHCHRGMAYVRELAETMLELVAFTEAQQSK